MKHDLLTQKIIEHLEGLNELERKTDSQNLIRVISERYEVPEEIVIKALAEWQAGKK